MCGSKGPLTKGIVDRVRSGRYIPSATMIRKSFTHSGQQLMPLICLATVLPIVPAMAQQQATAADHLRLIHRVDPEYPKIAKQTGAKGMVQMQVTVAPDGHVTAVKVLSGHPMLQNAAKDAVMQWIYTPQPTETTETVMLNFVGDERESKGVVGEEREPRGGSIRQAVLISRKEPVYPSEAKAGGIAGAVVLNAIIAKDGHVKSARVIKGHPILGSAAVDAVQQWFYKPTMLNGEAVETETQITLNFVGERSATGTSTPGFEKPELIEGKEPVHPGGDLANVTGNIVFRAKVGLDGRLTDIHVSDGPADLVAPALQAVKQWKYRPGTMNGQPVEAYTDITLRFTTR
jgi:TonB family protein